MTERQTGVVILAAGKGTRMKSDSAKVLHILAGRPMIAYVLETAVKVAGRDVVVVIGSQADTVRQTVASRGEVLFAHQKSQNGTGDAVRCALPVLPAHITDVVILCGDVPLISADTLNRLIRVHQQADHAVTFLGVNKTDPSGYGRVVANSHGAVKRIVEEADANPEEKRIQTVNSGVYCVCRSFLETAIPRLGAANAQQEIYLTDIIEIAAKSGLSIGLMMAENPEELLGINTREDLEQVAALLADSGKILDFEN